MKRKKLEAMNLWGKGLNQSIALARAGAKVYHAGMVGTDGAPFIELCKENGIQTDYIEEVDDVSGHAIIQINQDGENCILLYEGANGKNSLEHIQTVLQDFQQDDLLLLQNEINKLDELTRIAYEKGMMIVLNPSPFNERLTKDILGRVSLFLMNEIEGFQITGKQREEEILDVMARTYPNAKVLLTLGKKGNIYQEGKNRVHCNSYKVAAIDTTAAGDTYTGYFIASLQKGMAVKEAMEMASAAAALAVMKKGASTSIPLLKEVEKAEFRTKD